MLPLSIVPFVTELILLFLLLVVGLFVIIFIAKVVLFILPGAIVGAVVWFLTGSLFWGGNSLLSCGLHLYTKELIHFLRGNPRLLRMPTADFNPNFAI